MNQHSLQQKLGRYIAALELEPARALLQSRLYTLGMSEGLVSQKRIKEAETLLTALKFSPVIPILDLQDAPVPDPWDCLPQPPKAQRFDPGMYRAALAYYGHPETYRRAFAKAPEHGLEAVNPGTACNQGRAVWVQANLPAATYPLKKAGNSDIETIMNLTLDFEYPPEPALVHMIALEFAATLTAVGIAESPLPVEDSGAGAHIVIPLVPFSVQEHGGPELVNEAIKAIVHDYLNPDFNRIAARWGLAGKIKLEAFDISRIISVPGTYRPGGSKEGEAFTLKGGYLRRWLEPFDKAYPARVESESLTVMIQAKAAELATAPKEQPKPEAATIPVENVIEWLEGYSRRHPPEVLRKNGNGFDRSVYFHRLVWATSKKFGASVAKQYASEINRLASDKYSNPEKEVERSLRSA